MTLILFTETTKVEYNISTLETSYVSEVEKDAGAIHNICVCVGLHVIWEHWTERECLAVDCTEFCSHGFMDMQVRKADAEDVLEADTQSRALQAQQGSRGPRPD